MQRKNFENLIKKEINLIKFKINKIQWLQIWTHYKLLNSWNNIHNLTAINKYDEAVYVHYIDCLIGLTFLKPKNKIADFGSGAGFPGIIAAIIWPEKEITLFEKIRKKCSFLQIVKIKLKLDNVFIKNNNFLNINSPKYIITRATIPQSKINLIVKNFFINTYLICWVGSNFNNHTDIYIKKQNLVLESEHSYYIRGKNKRKILTFKKII